MTRHWLLGALLIVALSFSGAACRDGGSGGETLTVQQYFAEVQAAYDVASERLNRSGQQLDPGQAEQEALQAIRNVLVDQAATLGDLASTLDGLEPPRELADVHDAAVAALQTSVVATEHDADTAHNAANMAAVSDAVNDDESNAAGSALADACGALERAGVERGITVDLDC